MTFSSINDPSYKRDCDLINAWSTQFLWRQHLDRQAVLCRSSGEEVPADEAQRALEDATRQVAEVMRNAA